MAELDSIPQKQTIEIAQAKLDADVVKTLTDLNEKSAMLISDFGQIYIRKKELNEELEKLDEILKATEVEFKSLNAEIKEVIDALDEKYPQGRINLQEGMVQYQPGAPTRKQLAEQQQQPKQVSSMKVVKE
jgi:multimeric flavodoxin WrbA